VSFFAGGSLLSVWIARALPDIASELALFPQLFSKERLFGGSDIRRDTQQIYQNFAIFDVL
jgi:hypothetical protein